MNPPQVDDPRPQEIVDNHVSHHSNDDDDENKMIKIVLVGDTTVGKSCLIRNYLHNTYSDAYEPTVLDVYKGTKSVYKRQVDVEIHDMSGDEHLGVNR